MHIDISSWHVSGLTVVGLATLLGYYFGHATKFIKLPSLIGYMVLGIILGPSIFHLLTEAKLDHMSFITEIALGFVAFSIGSELRLSALKRLGYGIISIILAESFMAFGITTLGIYLLTRDLPMSLIFGAMAPASAPAGTVAVIHECKAKGPLTKALYAVVGFDDGLAIVIFGFAAAISKKLLLASAGGEEVSILFAMIEPVKEIFLSFLVGGIIGVIFCYLVRRMQHFRDILIVVFGVILLATGLSVRWHLSLILTNMVIGFVMANARDESLSHRITNPLKDVMPLLFILFFCLAGAHLKLAALPALGLIGIVYIFCRTFGLMSGARLGAMLGNVNENVKKYVGLGILSQAGVAIGLSLIVKHEFDQISAELGIAHASEIGIKVLTTITATCIFFELIGPILTKIALKKAGEIGE